MPKPLFNTVVFFLLIGFSITEIFAQTSEAIVTGRVIEASSELPMEFVNVVLYKLPDTLFITGTGTDEEGIFEMEEVPLGAYFVQVSYIGFETFSTDNFQILNADDEIDLETLEIEMGDLLLADIEVVEEKSRFSQSIDRRIYNVENEVVAATNTATEILQNLPSVTADVNGQLSLRGTSNITFFINGRPSALLRKNSATVLQQMPANMIERIEVITNPSAKFRPDGTGGIINIVLKEGALEGFNGTLMGNFGNLERYNANLTLNYGSEKLSSFLSYGFRHADTPRDDIDEVINKANDGTILSTFDQVISASQDNFSHLINAGLTFELSDNDLFEVSGSYFLANEDRRSNAISKYVDFFNAADNENFKTNLSLDEAESEYEIGASLEHEFDEDHALALSYNYADFFEKEDGLYMQAYTAPTVLDSTFTNVIEIGGPTQEIEVEYSNPIGDETELEAGYAAELLKEEINMLGRNLQEGENLWVIDPARTSDFIFTQNIHALYATLEHSFGDFGVLGGLRAEQAFVTSNLVNEQKEIPNDYFRLYPTVHLSYELDDNKELKLSYSKRVNRADSDEQNPFPEYSDPNTREVGNPYLKPEQIHSVELEYRWIEDKITFQPSLYYRFKEHGFTEIVRTVEDNISETSFTNLSKDQSAGIEFILTGNINNFLNYDLSANAFYQQIDASDLGFSKNKSAFTFDAKFGSNIKITKSTTGQLNAYYRSSRITPQGEFIPIFLLNAGLRQDIFKRQAALVLTVSDLFNTLDYESIVDAPTLNQRTYYGRNSQIIYLGFIYHFGRSIQKKKEKITFEDKLEAGKKKPEE